MVQVIEKEVPIADAVRVEEHNGIVRVEGPRGTLERDLVVRKHRHTCRAR